jgi:competence protein ComEC
LGFWNIELWSRVFSLHEPVLIVAFLDIGQGDSIYIQAPNGRQMLIDGGKSNAVISELRNIMPIGDTSIDVVLATHADADHIGGLPAVITDYDISKIINNSDTNKSTQIFARLQQMSDEERDKDGAEIIHATSGMRIILDPVNNVYFDIYYPATGVTSPDSNDLSIVGRLVYGETEFMLTGDSPISVENKLVTWCRACLASDVLKAGHHGSKTSTSQIFLDAVNPKYAVISAGLNNTYGHPHKEVTDRLEKKEIEIHTTYEEGTVIFVSDGRGVRIKD